MTSIDQIMSGVQSFASSWALTGSRFDDGSMAGVAEEQRGALKCMIAAALADARREGAEQITRQAAEIERLRDALSEIHGRFVHGSRKLYTMPDAALDSIRATASNALKGT